MEQSGKLTLEFSTFKLICQAGLQAGIFTTKFLKLIFGSCQNFFSLEINRRLRDSRHLYHHLCGRGSTQLFRCFFLSKLRSKFAIISHLKQTSNFDILFHSSSFGFETSIDHPSSSPLKGQTDPLIDQGFSAFSELSILSAFLFSIQGLRIPGAVAGFEL